MTEDQDFRSAAMAMSPLFGALAELVQAPSHPEVVGAELSPPGCHPTMLINVQTQSAGSATRSGYGYQYVDFNPARGAWDQGLFVDDDILQIQVLAEGHASPVSDCFPNARVRIHAPSELLDLIDFFRGAPSGTDTNRTWKHVALGDLVSDLVVPIRFEGGTLGIRWHDLDQMPADHPVRLRAEQQLAANGKRHAPQDPEADERFLQELKRRAESPQPEKTGADFQAEIQQGERQQAARRRDDEASPAYRWLQEHGTPDISRAGNLMVTGQHCQVIDHLGLQGIYGMFVEDDRTPLLSFRPRRGTCSAILLRQVLTSSPPDGPRPLEHLQAAASLTDLKARFDQASVRLPQGYPAQIAFALELSATRNAILEAVEEAVRSDSSDLENTLKELRQNFRPLLALAAARDEACTW